MYICDITVVYIYIYKHLIDVGMYWKPHYTLGPASVKRLSTLRLGKKSSVLAPRIAETYSGLQKVGTWM